MPSLPQRLFITVKRFLFHCNNKKSGTPQKAIINCLVEYAWFYRHTCFHYFQIKAPWVKTFVYCDSQLPTYFIPQWVCFLKCHSTLGNYACLLILWRPAPHLFQTTVSVLPEMSLHFRLLSLFTVTASSSAPHLFHTTVSVLPDMSLHFRLLSLFIVTAVLFA